MSGIPSPSESSRTSSQKVERIDMLGTVVFAHIVKVLLPIVCVGVPVIMPVLESSVRPSGNCGDISHTAPGTALAGRSGVVIVLLTSTVGPRGPVPNGFESGPPIHCGKTSFGPSHIPSSSVSGSSGSVPISPVPL